MLKLLFVLIFTTSAYAKQSSCLSCHFDIIGKSIYIHQPVLEEKCDACHVPGENTSKKSKQAKKQKVTTIHTKGVHHYGIFYLKPGQDYDFSLTVFDEKGREVKKNISPLRLNLIPESKDTTPPKVLNFCISKIERGIFYSAQIEWITNEPSIFWLQYGRGHSNEGTVTGDNFSFIHKAILTGLEANSIYSVRIYLRDLFDNESSPYEINFEVKPMTKSCKFTSDTSEDNATLAISKFEIVRKGKKVIVLWDTTKMASTILTLKPIISYPQEQSINIKKPHVSFINPKNTVIAICKKCHLEESGRLAHPINIALSSKMEIPVDLPLIENRITCITCHNPHAENYIFMLRKSHKKELCISCHKGK